MSGKGKKNTFRAKQNTNKVVRMLLDAKSAYGKVRISFLDSLNKQASYSLFI